MKMNKEVLKEFKQIISYLERKDIPYFVDCGTLLAIIRQKELYPHELDKDIDFAVLENNSKIKKNYFPSFSVTKTFNTTTLKSKSGNIFSFCHFKKTRHNYYLHVSYPDYKQNSIKFTLIFFFKFFFCSSLTEFIDQRKNRRAFSPLLFLKKVSLHFPESLTLFFDRVLSIFITPLFYYIPNKYTETTYCSEFGIRFKIPLLAEEYLTYHYGADWKIVKKNWNWLKDDKAFK